jgi:hypothetical protein
MRVDGSAITGNATLFDGTAIETSQAFAILRLNKGTEIRLGSGSVGMLYRDHMVLQHGKSELSTSDSFQMQASGFHVIPTEANARGTVFVTGQGSIQVAAMTGVFQVTNSRGFVLAQVHPGSAMNFAMQAAGSTTSFCGKLTTSNGHFYVTESGGAVHEIVGHDVDKEAANKSFARFVDKHVSVSGTIDTSAQPTGGATNVVDVSSIDRGRCGAGAAAAGFGGDTAITVIEGGAAAAALGWGVYEAGTTASR